MVPAEAPQLVVVVVVDEPDEHVYGGVVAAPIFSKIAEQSLRYLKISPTLSGVTDHLPPLPVEEALPQPVQAVLESQDGETLVMPDCLGMSYRQVLRLMAERRLNIKLRGSGRVVEQFPTPRRTIRYSKEVWVRLAPPT